MRSSLLSMAAAALASTSVASPTPGADAHLAPLYAPPAPPSSLGPLGLQSADDAHLIPNSYIVVFKKGTHHAHAEDHKARLASLWAQEAGRMHKRGIDWNAQFRGLKHHYKIGKAGHFQGYSAHIPESILNHIRSLPEVAYVERDSIVTISDPFTTYGETTAPVAEGDGLRSSSIDTEYGAPWGLARLAHRKRLTFGTARTYPYEHGGGAGVDVYVIDTGVNIDHVELEGRAKWGKTIPQDPDQDLNGHGSHVAGTIASRAYGVAKNASIIAVKVLGAGGSGSMADVVAGIDWAATSAQSVAEIESKKEKSKHKGSVGNMSLGGGKSQALDDAVDGAVDAGLHMAVAAGNDNRDACTFSPAAAKNPITVGASTIADERAYFSNHGSCVDIFGPGLNIKSIWNTGNMSTNTISGTSMASPHIAGLAAYFLSMYPEKLDVTSILDEESVADKLEWTFRQGPQVVLDRFRQGLGMKVATTKKGLTPKQLKKLMIELSTKGILSDLPANTVNALAFNNVTKS